MLKSVRPSLANAVALAVALFILVPGEAIALMHPGNAENGKRLFRACAGCHSLNPGEMRVGPSLAGLIGRKAGSMPRFRYSQALRNSSIVWKERALDAWIANPRRFIPGNRMPFFGVRDPQLRKDLIAFLKVATRVTPLTR